MAANRTKSPQQSAALRAVIYQRYCCGRSQLQIAAELNMSQSSIHHHLKQARVDVHCEIEHRRADRLAELDRMRNEAWSAWEQDKTAQAAVFLNQVQQAVKQERALLGLDAPRSVVASVTVGELHTDTEDTVVGGPQEP